MCNGHDLDNVKSRRKSSILNWEDKIVKRLRDEAEGRIEPRQADHIHDGGPYQIANQMSRSQYQKKYNHFGTIGYIQSRTPSRNATPDSNTRDR